MTLTRHSYTTEVKASGDKGIVEAVVSVFDIIDRGGDIIRPGAFAKSLATKLPNFVWSHDWDRPIGKTIAAEELPAGDARLPEVCRAFGGLWVQGQCNMATQRGREAYEDLKFGAINEFSIGFRTVKEAYNQETGVRELLELELFEWSPVLIGLNQATATISVKSDSLAGSRLDEHAHSVLAAVTALNARLKDYTDLKAADDRKLNPERVAQAIQLRDALNEFIEIGNAQKRNSPEALNVQKEILAHQLWRLKHDASTGY